MELVGANIECIGAQCWTVQQSSLAYQLDNSRGAGLGVCLGRGWLGLGYIRLIFPVFIVMLNQYRY